MRTEHTYWESLVTIIKPGTKEASNKPIKNYQLKFDSSKKDRCLMLLPFPKARKQNYIYSMCCALYNHQSLSDGYLCIVLVQTETHTYTSPACTLAQTCTYTHKNEISLLQARAHTQIGVRLEYLICTRRLDTFLLTFFL